MAHPSLDRELRVRIPHSSESPHTGAISHLLLCPQVLSDPFLHPASVWAVLSQMWDWVSKLQIWDSCGVDPCWSSGRGSSHTFATCWCARKVVTWLCSGSAFMKRWSREPAPRLTALSLSPQSRGIVHHVGTTCSTCNQWDPQPTLPTPGSPPYFHTWAPLFQPVMTLEVADS